MSSACIDVLTVNDLNIEYARKSSTLKVLVPAYYCSNRKYYKQRPRENKNLLHEKYYDESCGFLW